MKLTDILEADVTSITNANIGNRQYGSDFTTGAERKAADQTITAPGQDTPPKIKVMKRPAAAPIIAALSGTTLPADEIPDAASAFVSTFFMRTPPHIGIGLDPTKLAKLQGMAEPMVARWSEGWYRRTAQALATAFGTWAERVETVGNGYFIVYLTAQYFEQTGIKSSLNTAMADAAIAGVIKQQNIGGLNSVSFTKTKTGVTARVIGMELVDANSNKALDIAMKQKFGDLYIKHRDEGELDMINGRPVPKGLTNYYFYFTKEFADHYSLIKQ